MNIVPLETLIDPLVSDVLYGAILIACKINWSSGQEIWKLKCGDLTSCVWNTLQFDFASEEKTPNWKS